MRQENSHALKIPVMFAAFIRSLHKYIEYRRASKCNYTNNYFFAVSRRELSRKNNARAHSRRDAREMSVRAFSYVTMSFLLVLNVKNILLHSKSLVFIQLSRLIYKSLLFSCVILFTW